MSLYLTLLLVSFVAPVLLSFDKRVHFYTHWQKLFPAIFIVAVIFIIWDVWFTKTGVWGFNETYHHAQHILELPIEEVLFFIIIPYCCVFIHEVIISYFPSWQLNLRATQFISLLIVIAFLTLIVTANHKLYTLTVSIVIILAIAITNLLKLNILSRFYPSFLIMIVPFVIVNGILTGTGIVGEVVWYNNGENLGVRIGTIPIEDFAYAFALILLVLVIKTVLSNESPKKIKT